MNQTKQNITTKSLELFNKNGIANVSLRDIAGELGISVGNLQYHYKKREDIVEALYFELVKKIDSIYEIETTNLLAAVLQISVSIMNVFYDYQFFLLDFVDITRQNGKIKSHYSQLSKQRELRFLQIVNELIKAGVLRKEVLTNEYQSFYKRVEVISNFWFSSKLIQTDVIKRACIDEYSFIISQSIYPYLTDEAKKEYASILSIP
ncbi:MAG: TetR/AcrR family transcriptional regulator [Putridiphycobacter sp.]